MKQCKWVNLLVLVLLVIADSLALAEMPQPFSGDFKTRTDIGATMMGKWFFSASKMRMGFDVRAPGGQ